MAKDESQLRISNANVIILIVSAFQFAILAAIAYIAFSTYSILSNDIRDIEVSPSVFSQLKSPELFKSRSDAWWMSRPFLANQTEIVTVTMGLSAEFAAQFDQFAHVTVMMRQFNVTTNNPINQETQNLIIVTWMLSVYPYDSPHSESSSRFVDELAGVYKVNGTFSQSERLLMMSIRAVEGQYMTGVVDAHN